MYIPYNTNICALYTYECIMYVLYIYVDLRSTIFVFTFDELVRLDNKINNS